MTQPCGLYVCGATACKTTCANDADCQSGNYCNGTACVPQKALAQACTADDQCSSAHCAPEGLCCASACAGQCQYCDGTGVCQYASGAPHAPRAACTGQGTAPCGGSCPGSSSACSYRNTTVQCKDSACYAFEVTCPGQIASVAASYCDGAGSCRYPSAVCCGNYRCTPTNTCRIYCSTDSDCFGGTVCVGGSCQ
jgi:hypothetical protein